ncbi:hypothetical protein SAMN06265379_101252 [Saccharicrinis carchari]|uniref:Uncharacterized protein n=1 Tax=Saccharicrinis carchari TaxID=1168039 RepID=A0A521AMC4_SACCC|nr:hypothetical protein [Saccharicrinis carchari]SMO35978.1 hypothetical protein SAMN06265379_101252 [Saccharicrinis carchari]
MSARIFYKSLILTASLMFIYISAWAQINESYKYAYADFDTNATGKLYFRLEINNFVKNNEYFGEYTEGRTLPGYAVQPSLMYYAGKNVRIKIGAHFLKYNGNKDFSELFPVVSAHIKLADSWDMILGNIRGNVQHRLIEPMYNPELLYLKPDESGVQFYHSSPKVWLDAWVDWEQFIFKGDSIPEMFTSGLSLDYKLTNKNAALDLSIPLQLTAFHLGGQISDYKTESYSLFNAVAGLKVSRNLGSGFLKKIALQTYFLSFSELTESLGLPFTKGRAIYPTGLLSYKHGEIMLGYWRSENYFAPKGSPLFWSISDHKKEFYNKNRSLVTTKFTFNKTILKQVKLMAQAATYYDMEHEQLEYSLGLSLTFTPNFFIAKLGFE